MDSPTTSTHAHGGSISHGGGPMSPRCASSRPNRCRGVGLSSAPLVQPRALGRGAAQLPTDRAGRRRKHEKAKTPLASISKALDNTNLRTHVRHYLTAIIKCAISLTIALISTLCHYIFKARIILIGLFSMPPFANPQHRVRHQISTRGLQPHLVCRRAHTPDQSAGPMRQR